MRKYNELEIIITKKDVIFKKICNIMDKSYQVNITIDNYNKIKKGEHIDNILKNYKKEHKDFIKYKRTPKEIIIDKISNYCRRNTTTKIKR